MKGEDLYLLEGSHSVGIERCLRGRSGKRGREVVGKSSQKTSYSSTVDCVGGSHNGSLDRPGLLRQPGLVTILQLLQFNLHISYGFLWKIDQIYDSLFSLLRVHCFFFNFCRADKPYSISTNKVESRV